ncbi:MAG: hypothetical protein HY718_21890 [Planctomycetes bacterium]|nr:hypothetical protein [Planctomycetota bacterium]
MSTLAPSLAPAASGTPASAAGRAVRSEAGVYAVGLAVVLVLALPLRLWGIHAPFESSDQAEMANLVLFSGGVRWIFAHAYGPVLAILAKVWAEAAVRLGWPLTESVFRSLTTLLDLAQVLVTWPLMRRLGCTRRQALAGMVCCAVLPAMVSNAHFAWSHMSAWLLTGAVALWATLAYCEDRRRWQLVLAGGALTAHCLSSAIAFGLPMTLLVVWIARWRRRAEQAKPVGARVYGWEFVVGFVLPCLAALAIIFGSWLWTGGGQLGHLIAKFSAGHGGWRWGQIVRLPGMWIDLFGYLFGVIAAAGLLHATCSWRTSRTADRRGLLAMWAWSSLVPFMLVADWDHIGYVGGYVIETVYCAALLGMLLACELYGRLARRPRLRAATAAVSVLAVGHLAFGAIDACLAGGRWSALTGVSVPWGTLRPDTGIKAAGWYVRRHVPPDVIVMSLHNNKGMEAPVAAVYTGRHVLAGYDLPDRSLDELVTMMEADVDVVIVPAENWSLVERLAGFERVCTIRRDSWPVRFVCARAALHLARVDADTDAMNRRYDDLPTPERLPTALACPAAFPAAMGKYKTVVAQLRRLP